MIDVALNLIMLRIPCPRMFRIRFIQSLVFSNERIIRFARVTLHAGVNISQINEGVRRTEV